MNVDGSVTSEGTLVSPCSDGSPVLHGASSVESLPEMVETLPSTTVTVEPGTSPVISPLASPLPLSAASSDVALEELERLEAESAVGGFESVLQPDAVAGSSGAPPSQPAEPVVAPSSASPEASVASSDANGAQPASPVVEPSSASPEVRVASADVNQALLPQKKGCGCCAVS